MWSKVVITLPDDALILGNSTVFIWFSLDSSAYHLEIFQLSDHSKSTNFVLFKKFILKIAEVLNGRKNQFNNLHILHVDTNIPNPCVEKQKTDGFLSLLRLLSLENRTSEDFLRLLSTILSSW